MCGIAGLLHASLELAELKSRLAAMQARLRHRGPDDQGIFLDAQAGMGLAHTRLSILDLSPAGHQPMQLDGDRYTITFNGEIYNFAELRAELVAAGSQFKSHSDTEVILELYRLRGEQCVDRLVGMYAFAIWDRREQTCFLARGPMGIKPLYYWKRGATLGFASEVRALLAADLAPRRICPEALRGYLMYGAVQEPQTLVDGVETLPPGCSMTWRDGRTTLRRFSGIDFPAGKMEHVEAVRSARKALEDSVRRHFVSDVPVSIFLSGGIDSTAIVALARRCGFENLKTYSISFDEAEFNEGDVAARTAKHFHTDHCDWRMTAADGRNLFAQFLDSLDQPSNDGFNTYCVSKLAHDRGAKVVLSGLGGDEIFGGYQSFHAIPQLLKWHRRFAATPWLQQVSGIATERLARQIRWQRAGTYLQSNGGLASAYWTMRGIFTPVEAERLVARYLGAAGVGFSSSPFGDEPPSFPTPEDGISYLEVTRYMQNQLLRDSDVMSMAWGLELRVPFVDKALFDSVSRIPASMRLAAGKKMILEAVPEIPPWVAEGRKRGFAFPFENWMSGEWSQVFTEIDRTCPVRLGSWYRRWVLFTLEHCLRQYDIVNRMVA